MAEKYGYMKKYNLLLKKKAFLVIIAIKKMEGQTFIIHFKRKCPQRQITECLGVKLKGFALLKHSKR